MNDIEQRRKDAQRLIDWLYDRDTPTVSTRDAQRLSPVRNGARLDDALDNLARLGYVQVVQDGRKVLIQILATLATAV